MLRRNWKKLLVVAALILWAFVITIDNESAQNNVADNSQYVE